LNSTLFDYCRKIRGFQSRRPVAIIFPQIRSAAFSAGTAIGFNILSACVSAEILPDSLPYLARM